MRVSEFKCCFNSVQRVSGLALKLADMTNRLNSLELEPFGNVETGICETFTLDDSYIKSIEITSDLTGIATIGLISSTNEYRILRG